MKKPNDSRGFTILSILLLIIVPVVWFILDVNDIPSKLGIPVSSIPGQWSIILIGYFASVAGAITGFIATAYSVKKNIDNQNEARKIDNAIAALPLIQISSSVERTKPCDATIECKFDNTDIKNKIFTLGAVLEPSSTKIAIKNVGQREMYNVQAKCKKSGRFLEESYSELSPIIYKNEEIIVGLDIRTAVAKNYYESQIELFPMQKYSEEPIVISIMFDDCYSNTYEQLMSIVVSYELRKANKKTYQIFDNAIVKKCKVISAPQQIK